MTAAGTLRLGRVVGRDYGILVALAAFLIVVQTQNDTFFTQTNLLNIGQQWSSVGIMAVGMTFVLVGGGFDLSVGAVYAFSATLAAGIGAHHSAALAFAAALAMGAGVGLVNGLLITKVNVNPFITTLGTGQMIRGFALVYSGANILPLESHFFTTLGDGHVGAVPVSFIILVVVFAVGAVVLARSVYGRWVYAIGGNDEASYLSGIRTDAVRTSTYVLSSTCAAFAGCIYVGRLGSGQASIGQGIEFDVIAAALIGGISIMGGAGAMWRTAAGLALLAVLQNFFNQTNVNGFWQSVVKGGIIVGAVAIDSFSKRPRKRPLRMVVQDVGGRLWRRPQRGGPAA